MTQGEPKFPQEWDGRTFLGAWPRKSDMIVDTTRLYTTGPALSISEELNDLKRRVARLETMQRRKPKRKAGRR